MERLPDRLGHDDRAGGGGPGDLLGRPDRWPPDVVANVPRTEEAGEQVALVDRDGRLDRGIVLEIEGSQAVKEFAGECDRPLGRVEPRHVDPTRGEIPRTVGPDLLDPRLLDDPVDQADQSVELPQPARIVGVRRHPHGRAGRVRFVESRRRAVRIEGAGGVGGGPDGVVERAAEPNEHDRDVASGREPDRLGLGVGVGVGPEAVDLVLRQRPHREHTHAFGPVLGPFGLRPQAQDDVVDRPPQPPKLVAGGDDEPV